LLEPLSQGTLSGKAAAKWNEEKVSDTVVSFGDRLLKG
jgi:hypothetical protein